MFCAVGLNVCLHRDIVLQTWLHEEADVGCQVDLQTDAEGSREQPRCADGGLVGSLMQTIHIEVRLEG